MTLSLLVRVAEPLRRWLFALVEPAHALCRPQVRMRAQRPRVAVLVALGQDIAALSSLLAALRQAGDLEHEVWVEPQLAANSPQTLARWRAAGDTIVILPRVRVLFGLYSVSARADLLVSAAESTEGAHRIGHALARLGRRGGAATLTLQHGLENVGLTYLPPGRVAARFASDTVAIWGPVAGLVPGIPEETRRKCVPVGRLADLSIALPAEGALSTTAATAVLTVFENLHWERYSARYRSEFWADLGAVARTRPDLRLRLRPHPAAAHRADPVRQSLVESRAVTLARPDATVAELAMGSLACVTTPSTVALDIAQIKQPIAIAAYDLDLPLYAPLPQLRSTDDWAGFLVAARERRSALQAQAETFVQQNVVPGLAVDLLMALIRERLVEGRVRASERQSSFQRWRRRTTKGA